MLMNNKKYFLSLVHKNDNDDPHKEWRESDENKGNKKFPKLLSKSIFFGTPDISVHFLEKLKELGFMFDLVVTNPDAPVGRKKVLTPPPVKA